jgi:hypothetical protein
VGACWGDADGGDIAWKHALLSGGGLTSLMNSFSVLALGFTLRAISSGCALGGMAATPAAQPWLQLGSLPALGDTTTCKHTLLGEVVLQQLAARQQAWAQQRRSLHDAESAADEQHLSRNPGHPRMMVN